MTTPQKTASVMIVDDEELDQMIYKRVVDRSGLVKDIITFSSASEALAHLQQANNEPVDVVFVDVQMPRMSGFEFVEQAKATLGAAFDQLRVVLLTSSLDPVEAARARALPAVTDYLQKPLTPDDLERVLRQEP